MWNTTQTQLQRLWDEDVLYVQTASSWIQSVISFRLRLKKKTKRLIANTSVSIFVVVLASAVLYPTIANADMANEQLLPDAQTVALIIEQMQNETRPYGNLPESGAALPHRVYTIPLTAYTSEVGQTDDTPCITASGLDVCERNEENVVAANFLPLGTRVRIPELYGDRVFYVEDRMNKRYTYKMDIWMKSKSDAKQFGLQKATIEVF